MDIKESGDELLLSLEGSLKRVVSEAHRICRERSCEVFVTILSTKQAQPIRPFHSKTRSRPLQGDPLFLAYLACQLEVQQGWGEHGSLQQVQQMDSTQVSNLALKIVEKLTTTCAAEISTGKLQVRARCPNMLDALRPAGTSSMHRSTSIIWWRDSCLMSTHQHTGDRREAVPRPAEAPGSDAAGAG
jgi:hypothetical protein